MERDEKNEANERDERDEAADRNEASERDEVAEASKRDEVAEASKRADRDIEIFESLGLSDELKLVCEYIAENLSMSYFRGKPELHAMDAVREIMKDFLEVLKGCYAGYDGLPGKMVEYDDLLDVYRAHTKKMEELLRKYCPFY